MENDSTVDRAAAVEQLAALRDQRSALADHAVQPWWYDASLGLLVAAFVSSYATRDLRWVALALAVLGAGALGLVRVYRRRTGTWVSGLRPGATQAAVRAWMVFYAVVLAAGAAVEYLLEVRGAMVVAGIVIGVGLALVSRWWSRLYVAELRGAL
ncbi:hypothetical protein GCM10027451_35440 [Geodermatophilus aquaeductus]|uniref:Uncharacterized protein n=1 Tax=Geodermatophilus aquaeductus TaxID=1564161 RepID=A0A521FRU9_9ACTN|nr:hypothetical protein [Geodermatophilus aquaeductus]SMO98804.1 hypothetical protein SAMN06273567_11474 [Geodermatophilus aquaeductus]